MELHQLAGALRRMRTFIVLCALLGLALAAVALQLVGPGDYRATATLLLDPNAVTTPQQKQFIGDPERYVDGQLRLIQSKAIADAAAEKVPGDSGESLSRAITFTQVTGSDLVDVTATADDPALARDRANALVTTYVEQRRAETKAAVDTQLAAVRAQLTDLEQRLARTSATTQAQERGLLLNQYQTLIAQESTLASPGVTQDLTAVVDPAVLPREAQGLPAPQVLGAGFVLGAAFGAGTAVLVEAKNPRVGTAGQVERTVGAPTLARFTRSGSVRRLRGGSSSSTLAQARIVASVIVAREQESKPRVVALTTVSGEGVPDEVSTALREAFVEQGMDATILVAERLSEPSGGEAQLRPETTGSTDAWPRQVRRTDALPMRTPTLPRDEQVRAVVEGLPSHHEVALLVVPPVLRSPLAASASRWVDDVLLLVDVRKTTQHELELAWPMFGPERERCHVLTYR